MTDSWHSYPKVHQLGHAAIAEIFADPVIVQEKVDGSQFSFGVFGGKLRVRSKGREFEPAAVDSMFARGVETVLALAGKLRDGWTYRGEYLQKPKHNALAYDRVPAQHVILFDINTDHEAYLPHAEIVAEAERLGVEAVPLVFSGKLSAPSEITAMLDRVSVLGGQKIEGLVVKNHQRFGKDGKALMGKYVTEAFKETHAREWVKDNPKGGDILDLITANYRSDARWAKAVQHIAERGELQGAPQDIAPLLKEVVADIKAECAEQIMGELFAWAWPHIRRGVTRGLPEWYKQKLLDGAFGPTP